MSDNMKPLAAQSRVMKLVLERQDSELSINLTLHEIDSNRDLEIRFDHVLDVRFRGQPTLSGIVLLLSEDVSSRGLERVRHYVRDSEEEFISFACERITESEPHRVLGNSRDLKK